MRQHRFARNWLLQLSLLTVAALLLATFPLATNASTVKNVIQPTAVRLVDANGGLITNVKLSARHAGSDNVRTHGESEKTGIIRMILPPGRYYFTGDISILNSRPAYNANFNGNHNLMFFYISEPVEVTENTGEIILPINSANYIDVVDIAGVKGFKLHVTQAELGINTNIHVHSSSDGVRLFLPMRKTYNFANLEGVLHLKWPVYAVPGLQFVLSAT